MLLHSAHAAGNGADKGFWNPRAARESCPARGAASVTPRFRRVNCRRTKVRLGRGPAACVVDSFWSSSSPPARELLTRRRPARTVAWPVALSASARHGRHGVPYYVISYKLARGVVSRTGYGADAPCTAAVVRGTSQTGRDLVSRLIRGFLARHFARHRYSNALIVMFLQYVLEYGSRLTLPKRASMIHPTRPPGNESWPTPNPTSTLFPRADGPILIQSIGQLYILIQLGP